MTDNLRIEGIENDDHRGGRMKKADKRKTFGIEVRYIRTKKYRNDSLKWLWDDLANWSTFKRYKTESARDEAFAAVVKKAHLDRCLFTRMEYRKV